MNTFSLLFSLKVHLVFKHMKILQADGDCTLMEETYTMPFRGKKAFSMVSFPLELPTEGHPKERVISRISRKQ